MLICSSSRKSECPRLGQERARRQLARAPYSNVVFRVHRLYLEAHSPVFKDMFALGSELENGAELPRVDLEETSEVLETCLPYVYPARAGPFQLHLEGDFGAPRMFHKYEVSLRSF